MVDEKIEQKLESNVENPFLGSSNLPIKQILVEVLFIFLVVLKVFEKLFTLIPLGIIEELKEKYLFIYFWENFETQIL